MLFDSGSFIEQELGNVQMSDQLQALTKELCAQMIDTAFEVLHELWDLDDLFASGASQERITSAATLILRLLLEDIRRSDDLVCKLQAAAEDDLNCASAFILVAECGVNLLNPFIRAKSAAEALHAHPGCNG